MRTPAACIVFSLVSAAVSVAQCPLPPSWTPFTPSSENVTVVVADGTGGIHAGGSFLSIGGTAAARVARWDGVAWQALGGGVSGGVATVSALLRTSTGELIVGGTFTTAGAAPAANIARWDGSQWHALGAGIGGFHVGDLAELPNGDVIALGNFTTAGGVAATNIARWNGVSWAPLGAGITSPGGMLVLANGDLIAGGSIAGVTGFVGRWNGLTWSSVGNLASMVPNAFAELPNGDLIAGGYQTVQRWNGAAWSVAGTVVGGNLTTVYDMARHPDGSAIVVGGFSTVTAGVTTNVRGVARLDPLTAGWSDLASSTALSPLGLGGLVGDVLVLGDGGILLAAAPALVGDTPRSVLAIGAGCPASVVVTGPGCGGSGTHVLAALTQPWVETTFRSIGTGLPAPAFVLSAYGLSPIVPALPLASVLPQALPGCDLHVQPDGVVTLFTSDGTVESTLHLPNVPPLVGVSLWHQMAPVVLDSQLQVLSMTATNALQITVGAL